MDKANIGTSRDTTFTVDDKNGGSFTDSVGYFPYLANGGPPGTPGFQPTTDPVHGTFSFLLSGVSTDPANPDPGPLLWVHGTLSGTLSAGGGSAAVRYSGLTTGTVTGVELFYSPGVSYDPSLLPSPLLDILNHPDHIHYSLIVTGGSQNRVDSTLTFSPPSPPQPAPVPEPTTLAVFTLGAVALGYRTWRASRSPNNA